MEELSAKNIILMTNQEDMNSIYNRIANKTMMPNKIITKTFHRTISPNMMNFIEQAVLKSIAEKNGGGGGGGVSKKYY